MTNKFLPKIKSIVASHPEEFMNEDTNQLEWFVSYDNAKIHTSAVSHGLLPPEMVGSNRVPQPALSPDMHKPIEHQMGNLKHGFQEGVDRDFTPRHDPNHYKQALVAIAPTRVTKDGVYNDLHSMHGLWAEIIKLGGHYPKKGDR